MATACARRLLQGTSVSLHLKMIPNRSTGTFDGSTSSGTEVSSEGEASWVVSVWDFPTPIYIGMITSWEKIEYTHTLQAHLQIDRTTH